jgi:amino acid transporter
VTEKQAEQDSQDAHALQRLGYAQELRRALGGFSNFAISFSIISVLTGITTTYATAIGGAGPAGLGIGWPLVSVGTLIVAVAMAELASAFPTAGALYHWAALLGGAGWGWLTAAMNLVGQVAIVAAIDLGCAQALAATLRLSPGWAWPLLGLVLLSHGLLNAFSVKLVAWLNSFSATVHVVGVLIVVVALFGFARAQPVSFLFERGFTLRADGVYALGFLNALILGMWTFTGYDASAHVSEETHDPARRAPRGIVSAVGVSAIFGYALACALTLAIHDLPAIAKDAQPPLAILRVAFGERAGNSLMACVVLAMWFCGLSSVTSASRMLFAFSRDEGLPGWRALRSVSPRFKTPIIATTVAIVAPLTLCVATAPFSDAVFLAVASLATTALYVSYALPIGLGAIARRRKIWVHEGPWNVGRFGVPIAWAAVLWCAFVLVVCGLPPNGAAGVLIASVSVVLALCYALFVRGRFQGPKVTLREIEGLVKQSAEPKTAAE